jgi:hypothetical protein
MEDAAEGNRRGWALEQTGAWDEAAAAYSAAFRLAVCAGAPEPMADAVRGGARVRHRQGRLEEADEMARLGEQLAVLHDLPRAAARAVNVRAMIRIALQDLDGARALFGRAMEGARRTRDDELLGLVAQNLGALANIQGDLREARLLYLESVAAAVRSGNKANAMMAYNNLGMLAADLREWLESELYFDRGIEIAQRLEHRPMLAKLHANSAEPLIHMGEPQRAAAALDRAEEVAVALGDPGTLALAMRFRAVLARLAGDHDAADAYLAQAAAHASAEGLELERAEILGGVARLRWAQGRHAEARAALHEARERFAALGAAREIRRLDEVLAEWTG